MRPEPIIRNRWVVALLVLWLLSFSALSHSTKQKNGTLDGTAPVATAYDSGGAIKIYTGSAPATADAAETGTILVTINLPTDVFPAVSGGVLTANAISAATISNTGTAGYGRIVASGDTGALVTTTQPRIQFAVGTSGSDMNFNTRSLVAAAQITITSLTYTHPS